MTSRRFHFEPICAVVLTFGLVALQSLASVASGEGLPFAITEIKGPGRTAQADLVDLDGDGLGDLIWISIDAVPPDERREVRVHFQRADDGLRKIPDWTSPLPSGVAAYDLADIDGRPGIEMILLRRDRITLLSFAGREPKQTDVAVPGDATIAVTHDERGVDRLRIALEGLRPSPLLMVPQFGATAIVAPDGTVVGRLDSGARANFFLPTRPGFVVAESEIEIYFDHPRIDVGDVDGDGRADILASNRHQLRVFRQREDHTFPSSPDQRHSFRMLREEDHIRSVGSVRLIPEDLDLDGRVDLVMSNSTGSLLAGDTELRVHRNRDGAFDFEKPDQIFRTEGGVTTTQLVDLDGDGRVELIDVRVPTGVLEIVEVLLTGALDIQVQIRRAGRDVPFEREPWLRRKFDLSINMDTFRSAGFVPTLNFDMNGDGRLDLVGSGDGDAIELWLGETERVFASRPVSQPLATNGRIRFGLLDRDELLDFVIYDPRLPGSPIRIGTNRGVLPGTVRKPALTPAPQ